MITTDSVNDIFQGFKIKAKCLSVNQNRHFSFYDVKLDDGTKISKIERYGSELALAMRVKTPFTVMAIPEKGIVRMHTTHDVASKIHFNEINKDCPSDHLLPFLFGETAEGQPLWVDMSKNPHLLVAGSTGSGKSVFLHNLIFNAIRRNDTQLFLVDTKRVEFNVYNDVKFNKTIWSVSDDYDSAVSMLNRAHQLMESRYKFLAERGLQSIEQAPFIFSKIVIIIDEVADLMLFNKSKEFETLVVRLAQKARAAGIYMVLATQRPSVDVLTGLIKSNFPARLSCRVSTKMDSRVVLDENGAEGLAGRGDAILKIPSENSNIRFQISYVNPMEVNVNI